MFFVSNLQSSSQLDVAGSNPVSRSMFSTTCTKPFQPVLRLCSIQNQWRANLLKKSGSFAQ